DLVRLAEGILPTQGNAVDGVAEAEVNLKPLVVTELTGPARGGVAIEGVAGQHGAGLDRRRRRHLAQGQVWPGDGDIDRAGDGQAAGILDGDEQRVRAT